MRVFLGTDHAGFELKEHLVSWLKANGHEPVDCGAFAYDAVDDYPPFVLRAAQRTAAEPGALGIVIGGSGNGEAIAANKVKGVRAALVWNEDTATLIESIRRVGAGEIVLSREAEAVHRRSLV